MADNRLEEAIQIIARKKAVEAVLWAADDVPTEDDPGLWLKIAEAMRATVSSPSEEEIAAAQDYLDQHG